MSVFDSSRDYHPCELALHVGDGLVTLVLDEKPVGVRELLQFSLFQHQDPVGINNGCESVGNDEHCAVSEPLTQRFLNQIVGL